MEKEVSILIDDLEYKTLTTKKHQNRKPWKKKDEKQIIAYIPGTIGTIFVKKNQKVKNGDALLILEAMKMRNSVTAPFDGVIKEVCVKQAENVAKNTVLIEFE